MEVTAAAISPGGRTRMSQKQVGRMNATVEQQKAKIREARELLEADYNQKVAAGELRPPTRLERMKATAAGHPDNPSVQAARRIVAKLEAKTVPAGCECRARLPGGHRRAAAEGAGCTEGRPPPKTADR
jgi:hypothetical protein